MRPIGPLVPSNNKQALHHPVPHSRRFLTFSREFFLEQVEEQVFADFVVEHSIYADIWPLGALSGAASSREFDAVVELMLLDVILYGA